MIVNRTYDELAVGDHADLAHVVTANDLYLFAYASGSRNPIHFPGIDGDGDGIADELAPATWISGLVSAVIGNLLPGAGTRYRRETLRFKGQARIGDRLAISVVVAHKPAAPVLVLDVRVRCGDSDIADGVIEVEAPARKISLPDHHLPVVLLDRLRHFDRLLAACDRLPPLTTAVVCPHDALSLGGAWAAREARLIAPVLVGVDEQIRKAARDLAIDLGTTPVVSAPDDAAAADAAVALVREGRAGAIMKGDLHTDTLMRAVLADGGLRGRRRVSHVFALDVPGLDHLLLISDAAINIAPDIDAKADIVRNAIDIAHAIGIAEPRVGILSAVETVNPAIPSSVDAARLAEMARRGEITGAFVDGPLAMDNAIDIEAARTKGLTSMVAGRANVLIVPNLESGNMLAKQLTFLSHAESAGLVLGATVPIMLTSRADDERARLMSAALAILYDDWRRKQPPEAAAEPASAKGDA